MNAANMPPASGRLPVCTLGKWVFVPEPADAQDDVRVAFLHSNGSGERVTLRHCSRLLADFVRAIRQLESEFVTRCAAVEPTPGA